MFQSCPIEESVDSEGDCQEFSESDPSSFAEEFESFIEDLVADKYDEDDREDDIAVREYGDVDEIESENGVESEEKQEDEEIEDDQ